MKEVTCSTRSTLWLTFN